MQNIINYRHRQPLKAAKRVKSPILGDLWKRSRFLDFAVQVQLVKWILDPGQLTPWEAPGKMVKQIVNTGIGWSQVWVHLFIIPPFSQRV